MTDRDRILDELGIVPRPAPTKPARPAGPPETWRGTYYPDGNIPH